MDNYLEAEGISNYKKNFELKEISLNVGKGEVILIGGSNGSGKTTLLETLCLIDKPSDGLLKYFGKHVFNDGKKTKFLRKSRKEIGAKFQSVELFQNLTLEEILKLYSENYGASTSKIESLVEECEPIHDYLRKKISQLSAGKIQLTKFLMSIAHDPKLVFLDEPETNLDVSTRKWVLKKILELKREGTSFLITLNKFWEVVKISDELLILEEGSMKNKIENFDSIRDGTRIRLSNSGIEFKEFLKKDWVLKVKKESNDSIRLLTSLKKSDAFQQIDQRYKIEDIRDIRLKDFYGEGSPDEK